MNTETEIEVETESETDIKREGEHQIELLNVEGLVCPEPVMLLHNKMRTLSPGDELKVVATDPTTQRDIPKFCAFLDHQLMEARQEGALYIYHIIKGG